MLRESGMASRDVYEPPTFEVSDGKLGRRARWLWRYYRYYKRCKRVAKGVMSDGRPGLVASDEDFASLAVAQQSGIPTVLITDILQTRFTEGLASLAEERMNRSMQSLICKADAVIMPEDGDDEGNVKRVGPIVRNASASREQLRKRFGFDRKTILISVGGTDAGEFLIGKALEAASEVAPKADVVVAAGPAIARRFRGVRNLGMVTNLHEWICAVDLLVSLAGKSTIDEAAAYGTPAIFIPIKDHFEQEDNAREQGYTFDDLYRLDSLIVEKLDSERRPSSSDGAKRAADIIRGLLPR